MDKKENIHFDDFNTSSVEALFGVSFSGIDLEKGGFYNVNYKCLDKEIEFEEFKASTNSFSVMAVAETIPVEKITKYEVGEEEKQEGYVFNGTIFVRPKEHSIKNLGAGGRILTFVSLDINTLEKLILGDTKTDEEINQRWNLIREGYPEMIKREEEARFQDKMGAFANGESSGSWKNRHGSY